MSSRASGEYPFLRVRVTPAGAGGLLWQTNTELQREVLHCVAVYTAVDAQEQPRAVDTWRPETPGDIALAQRVKAHIDAARAAQ